MGWRARAICSDLRGAGAKRLTWLVGVRSGAAAKARMIPLDETFGLILQPRSLIGLAAPHQAVNRLVDGRVVRLQRVFHHDEGRHQARVGTGRPIHAEKAPGRRRTRPAATPEKRGLKAQDPSLSQSQPARLFPRAAPLLALRAPSPPIFGPMIDGAAADTPRRDIRHRSEALHQATFPPAPRAANARWKRYFRRRRNGPRTPDFCPGGGPRAYFKIFD